MGLSLSFSLSLSSALTSASCRRIAEDRKQVQCQSIVFLSFPFFVQLLLLPLQTQETFLWVFDRISRDLDSNVVVIVYKSPQCVCVSLSLSLSRVNFDLNFQFFFFSLFTRKSLTGDWAKTPHPLASRRRRQQQPTKKK